MTEEEFMVQMGPYFHVKLLMYYDNLLKEEAKAQPDEIVNFDFPEGMYSIKYEDLKARADEETLQFLDDHDLELKLKPNGPVGIAGSDWGVKKRSK